MRTSSQRDFVDAIKGKWPSQGNATPEVLRLVDEATRTWPQSPEILRLRAALIQLAPEGSDYSLDDALDCYRRALVADPHAVETLEDLGHFYDAVLGNESEGRAFFERAAQERKVQGMLPNKSLERTRER